MADVCAYCASSEVTARKAVPGGYTIPVCNWCLEEDRREHDSDEPADEPEPEAA